LYHAIKSIDLQEYFLFLLAALNHTVCYWVRLAVSNRLQRRGYTVLITHRPFSEWRMACSKHSGQTPHREYPTPVSAFSRWFLYSNSSIFIL